MSENSSAIWANASSNGSGVAGPGMAMAGRSADTEPPSTLAGAGAPGGAAMLPHFSALVVEDNMLIAMDAEEALQELGAGKVQLCGDVASALISIGTAAFDVALLDVSLGDETSENIAVVLRQSGTPFIMTTGMGDYISDIAAYAGAPVLTKPYDPAALSHALMQVMR